LIDHRKSIALVFPGIVSGGRVLRDCRQGEGRKAKIKDRVISFILDYCSADSGGIGETQLPILLA
jgi:hypothetical protein